MSDTNELRARFQPLNSDKLWDLAQAECHAFECNDDGRLDEYGMHFPNRATLLRFAALVIDLTDAERAASPFAAPTAPAAGAQQGEAVAWVVTVDQAITALKRAMGEELLPAPYRAGLVGHFCNHLNAATTPAPAVERGVTEAPENSEFKNFHRALCERFNYSHDPVDWRRDQVSLIEHIAALTATTSPSDTELASHEEMGAVAMRDDGRLDADNWLPNGDVPAELADGWRWVDAKRVLILSPTLTATGAAQGEMSDALAASIRRMESATANLTNPDTSDLDPELLAYARSTITKPEAPTAQPLTAEQITAFGFTDSVALMASMEAAYRAGVRRAEHYHGIQPAATKGTT